MWNWIKLNINKTLEKGFWYQILVFLSFNVLVFAICISVCSLIDTSDRLSHWKILGLFIDSNSVEWITDFKWTDLGFLFIECLGAILFSGLVISIITNVISIKVEDIKEGHIHYKFNDHVVIIGYDDIVPSIIAKLLQSSEYGKCKIVLQTNGSISDIRNTLLTKLTKADLKKIFIYHAPRQSVEELEMLKTVNAREIFIVGNRESTDHDTENMYSFEELVYIHKRQNVNKKIPVTIWFENESSYAALQLNDISKDWKQYFDFKPYNFYKRWSNRLLTKSLYGLGPYAIEYPKLDHQGISSTSGKHIHLIIVGMNRMGIALAKEAAHLLHFPNFNESTGANRTRITFIDDNADIEKDFFVGRLSRFFDVSPILYADLSNDSFSEYKVLNPDKKHANFIDVQFEFIKGRVESNNVRKWIIQELKDDTAITSIAICLQDVSKAFAMAMYLPEEVYMRGRNDITNPWAVSNPEQVVNIFVRQENSASLIRTFSNAAKDEISKNKKYANLYPFGMLDDSFSLNYYSNRLAMSFNFVYDYYFSHNLTLPNISSYLDSIKPTWLTCVTSNQWSNLYLSDSIDFKLRSIGISRDALKSEGFQFTQEQKDQLAYTEHSRWNVEKLLMGYRVLTDEEQKLTREEKKLLKNYLFAHYDIVPFSHLTDADKTLDYNIIQILPECIRNID